MTDLNINVRSEWSKWVPVVVVVVIIILIAVGIYLYTQKSGLVKRLAAAKTLYNQTVDDYERQIDDYVNRVDVLERTAAKMRDEMENAPSDVTVRVIPIRVRETDGRRVPGITVTAPRPDTESAPASTTMPTVCVDCFSQVIIPYQFRNKYVVLDDVLRWNPETRQLESDASRRTFKVTDEFEKELVRAGVGEWEKVDDRVFKVRYFFVGDAGIKDNPDEVFTGLGIGFGAAVMHFRRYLKANITLAVSGSIVPERLIDTHVAVGPHWNFFRNTSIGLAYGRSIENNMILLQIAVFPFD